MPDLTNIFIQLGLALVFGSLASLAALPLCKPLKLIDHPGAAPHKQHARPTPLAGGLVLGMGLAMLFVAFPNLLDGKMRGAVLGAAIILVFGLWDDRAGLSARLKFSGQFLAVAIAMFSGIRIEFLNEIVPGGSVVAQILNGALTILWLVGITNAFNLIDSMDGIVAGLSALASAFFIFVTQASHQPELTQWAAILTGLSLALFFWNSPPARYFLGDGGAQTLGFLLATLALLYNPENKIQAASWFVPILILGVPIFDTTLVVFSRLRRGLPPFVGNRDHTYHRLMRGGMASGRAVSLLHLVALGLDSLAVTAMSQTPLTANLLFGVCLLAGGSLVYLLDFNPKFIPPPAKPMEKR